MSTLLPQECSDNTVLCQNMPDSCCASDCMPVWHYRDHLQELSSTTLTLRELLLLLHRKNKHTKTTCRQRKALERKDSDSVFSENETSEVLGLYDSDSGCISATSNGDEKIYKHAEKTKKRVLSIREVFNILKMMYNDRLWILNCIFVPKKCIFLYI